MGSEPPTTWVVAADIGGTFTDLVAVDHRGAVVRAKVLSTPDAPDRAMVHGLDVLDGLGVARRDIARFVHGSTLVANALVQRTGARTALLATEGFRDLLETGTEGRYDFYDAFAALPEPLVPRWLRFEVRERMGPDGSEWLPVDLGGLDALADQLRATGVESVAISFLHAPSDGRHEEQVAAGLVARGIDVPIALSSQVAPRIREYERTSTTVANAYVTPLARTYLDRLDRALTDVPGRRYVMQSEGGVTSFAQAARLPVKLAESGQAGAVLLGADLGRTWGDDAIVSFDMGGTTAKVSMVERAAPTIADSFEVARAQRFARGSGLPLSIPSVDVIEIGAGGGSIAWVDRTGLLQVGPESAGADPGPACYGSGGERPTVTDVDLVLGFLPTTLADGVTLDLAAAEKALAGLADSFAPGMPVEDIAENTFEVVSEAMASAALAHALDRGQDISTYTFVATGGAGPVHAWRVAELCGASRLLVPGEAGVGSAVGLLTAPVRATAVRSLPVRLDEGRWAQVDELLVVLEAEVRQEVTEAGGDPAAVRIERTAAARFIGQWHTFAIEIPDGPAVPGWERELADRFAEAHARVIRRSGLDFPIEVIDWRITAEVASGVEATGALAAGRGREATRVASVVRIGGQEHPCPVVTELDPGAGPVAGPLLIDQATNVVVVPPGWQASYDGPSSCFLLERV